MLPEWFLGSVPYPKNCIRLHQKMKINGRIQVNKKKCMGVLCKCQFVTRTEEKASAHANTSLCTSNK